MMKYIEKPLMWDVWGVIKLLNSFISEPSLERECEKLPCTNIEVKNTSFLKIHK